MQLQLDGPIDRPAVAVLGTWDPFLPEHDVLLTELRDSAHARGLTALAVMLDPAPPAILRGPGKWPEYSDGATRVDLLRATGIDAVAVISFCDADLGLGAVDFFGLLCGSVPLVEFWLKDGQSVGQAGKGGDLAIRVQAARRKFKLHRLPATSGGRVASDTVRAWLGGGHVQRAVEFVGRAPTWHRPPQRRVPLAWGAGWYTAEACAPAGPRFDVCIAPDDTGIPGFEWPDARVDALRFVAGPADHAASQLSQGLPA